MMENLREMLCLWEEQTVEKLHLYNVQLQLTYLENEKQQSEFHKLSYLNQERPNCNLVFRLLLNFCYPTSNGELDDLIEQLKKSSRQAEMTTLFLKKRVFLEKEKIQKDSSLWKTSLVLLIDQRIFQVFQLLLGNLNTVAYSFFI